jgi:hypothetical protein
MHAFPLTRRVLRFCPRIGYNLRRTLRIQTAYGTGQSETAK